MNALERHLLNLTHTKCFFKYFPNIFWPMQKMLLKLIGLLGIAVRNTGSYLEKQDRNASFYCSVTLTMKAGQGVYPRPVFENKHWQYHPDTDTSFLVV